MITFYQRTQRNLNLSLEYWDQQRTCSISPDVNNPGFRNINFDDLQDDYEISINALIDSGVDLIMVETIFDTLNAKAALMAIKI